MGLAGLLGTEPLPLNREVLLVEAWAENNSAECPQDLGHFWLVLEVYSNCSVAREAI